MMMKSMQRFAAKVICVIAMGCQSPWVFDPLSFECRSMPILILAPEWKAKDENLLEQQLTLYNIPLTHTNKDAFFEVVCQPIQRDTFSHYADTVRKSFYKNYESRLSFSIIRIETQEIVLEKTLSVVHTLKDSPHVYQDSEIARANVIYQQQLELFDLLAKELKSICAFAHSGKD